MHENHGMNMVQRYLSIGFEDCEIRGRQYAIPSMHSCDRSGMMSSGEITTCFKGVSTTVKPDSYPLEQSFQDSYPALVMKQALATGQTVKTTHQLWTE